MSARHRVSVTVPVRVEIVNVKNRREVMLERPPFCKDGHIWRLAVNRVREMKRRGNKSEPFLLATQVYTELGGQFV